MRRAVRFAGQVHDPAHALNDEVVPGARRIGPVLAEAGDRAIDEARVERRQARIIEPVFGERADLEVFDHDIGIGDEVEDGLPPPGRGEVGDDGALAPVAGVEIGGVGRPVRIVDEGRPPAARVVACGMLDLDHLGPQIGKRLPRPRPGQDTGKLNDLQAGEGVLLRGRRRGHQPGLREHGDGREGQVVNQSSDRHEQTTS